MKKTIYFGAALLVLVTAPSVVATGEVSEVSKIVVCDGLQGAELENCLRRQGVQASIIQDLTKPLKTMSDGLFGAWSGFHDKAQEAQPLKTMRDGLFGAWSGFRDKAQEAQRSASSFANTIRKGASNLFYSAMGKADIAKMAEEGGRFLGSLYWYRWGHDSNNPFPACIKVAEIMPDTLKKAVQQWRNALLDQGIPASKPANVDALRAMGYVVAVNQVNLTVISGQDKTSYWLKSPWGWLPCSADGKKILNNSGKDLAIDQINEAISSGTLTPLIWIKEENRMENFSEANYGRLVENNLDSFIKAQTH